MTKTDRCSICLCEYCKYNTIDCVDNVSTVVADNMVIACNCFEQDKFSYFIDDDCIINDDNLNKRCQ